MTFRGQQLTSQGLKETFIIGDLLKGDQTDTLISVISDLGLEQLISSATRITAESATCIDHVYAKKQKDTSNLFHYCEIFRIKM